MVSRKRTVEILKCARATLEKGWTYGTEARDKNGREVNPKDPAAIRFCAVGAISHCATVSERDEVALKAGRLLRELPTSDRAYTGKHFPNAVAARNLVEFNDESRSKKQVLALFDKLIAHAERKG